MRARLPVLALGILLIPTPAWAQFRPIFNLYGSPGNYGFGGGYGGYAPRGYGNAGYGYSGFSPYYWSGPTSVPWIVPGWAANDIPPAPRMRPTNYPAVPIPAGEDLGTLISRIYPGNASGSDITIVKGEVAAARPEPARLQIHLPRPDAQLWIENTPMQQTGSERTFVSPPLDPGSKYSYSLRASWQENGKTQTENRKISVNAGQQVSINFARP